MSSKRRKVPPRTKNPPTATFLRDLTQEQAAKIAKDFRCADCGTASVLVIKACESCAILGLEASHDPSCPVRTGAVSPVGNYLAALAA